MITFPNAKINLGLRVLGKRDDGFHNLETIFYPVPVCDILEIVICDNRKEISKTQFRETAISLSNGYVAYFSMSGNFVGGNVQSNLVVKALLLFDFYSPINESLAVHLHKIIPTGSGLGGGSSDAVFALQMLNKLKSNILPNEKILELAAQLGSDCPFFVSNKPSFAAGRGEILTPVNLTLSGKYLVLIKPDCSVSTAEAFSGVRFGNKMPDVSSFSNLHVNEWKNYLDNDFEYSVFKKYPQIEEVKDSLISQGADYVSMSGSGSAVYGIFSEHPGEIKMPDGYAVFVNKLS